MFTFDGSYSFYTKDRIAPALDSISDGWLRLANGLITVNGTTSYFKAFKTSLNYQFTPSIVTGIEYRRVDPGFHSMGSYFFNNDVQHITFNQTVGLMDNKLSLRGSLGIQNDNLDGSKASTAHRVIGSLSGNYTINENWAVDASFNNYSTNQRAYKTAGSDSLQIYQVNRTFMLMPRFTKSTATASHMVILNLNYTTLQRDRKSVV